MFANAYQNGSYLEIFDSKVNQQKNEFYKQLCKITPHNNKRYFDKDVKSYLWQFNGHNSKLLLPADDHKQLCIHQRYLILQIYIPIASHWSLEIGLTDISKIKRRINITTTANKQQTKYFSLRYPINVIKGSWIFLSIDVLSFMNAFKGQVFRSLDHISVGSNCKIRRIFTLKQWNQWDIPKNYWLTSQLQQNLQLIQYDQHKQSKNQDITISHLFQPSRVKSLEKKKTEEAIKSYQYSPSYPKHKNQSSLIKNSPKQVSIHMTKSQLPPIHNSKIKINTLKQEKPILKNYQKPPTKVKPPFIGKTFREDQALMVPQEQSDIAVQSHSKQSYHPQVIEQDKWSEEQAEKKKKIQHNEIKPILSNIFPSTLITKQNKKTVSIQKKNEKQLQLIYDEMVGCYYHPQTNTYYEINP